MANLKKMFKFQGKDKKNEKVQMIDVDLKTLKKLEQLETDCSLLEKGFYSSCSKEARIEEE